VFVTGSYIFRQEKAMGSTASIQSDQFEKLKAEFETKKDTLSDEELFNHMKVFYEGLTQLQTQTTVTPVAETAQPVATAAESPP
jgi:hypothetical protein